MVVLGTAALLVGAACLPDLDAFPDAPETSILEPSPSPYCGDGVIETLEDGGVTGETCDPGDAATSTAGCENCQITCAGTLDRASGHCYFLADPSAKYQEALEYCRHAGAHVVTIGNPDEARFVDTLDAGEYWIGLAERPDLDNNYWTPNGVGEPGWPSSGTTCSGCFARAGDAGLFAAEPGAPDAGPTTCLVAQGSSWLTAPCAGPVKRSTLCEREPLGSRIEVCGGLLCTTLLLPDAGAKRYVIWPSAVTADEAFKTCKNSYDGGSLVMFDSREEREYLMREIAQRLGTDDVQIWIGLAQSANGWAWDDDAGGRPSPWGDGEPSGQGARAFVVLNENQYDTQLAQTDPSAPQDAKRFFVCQRPIE